MKAAPVRLVRGEGYIPCAVEEATHVTINIPGPNGKLTLPFILKGKREGTGCWTWNGDTEKPTLKPSIKSTHGHYLGGTPCWCDYNREHPNEPHHFTCFICHTWINDGQAIFLDDTTHELRGQTVDLLDV
jgi:hypothetical protein